MIGHRDLGLLGATIGLALALCGCVARDRDSSNGLSELDARRVKARNVYSPNIAGDPYVVEEQRRIAQALRQNCETAGEHCREADAAEQFVARAEARRTGI